MTYVTLDAKFFIHVFIGFAITSLMLSAVLIYEVNRVSKVRGKFWQKINLRSSVDDLWSNDPDLMDGVALLRGRREEGSSHGVTLTQITYNDSCFGFLWSKFHVEDIVKYAVQVTNVRYPDLTEKEEVIGGVSTDYKLCGLNVSTPYHINLTAIGKNPGAMESAFGIMWTTHEVPPPPAPIKVLDVGERTITITIPEVVLTKGPLTSVEVRLILRAKIPPPPVKDNPWTNYLSREKRSNERRSPANVTSRLAEVPFYLLALHLARRGEAENETSRYEYDRSSKRGNQTRHGVPSGLSPNAKDILEENASPSEDAEDVLLEKLTQTLHRAVLINQQPNNVSSDVTFDNLLSRNRLLEDSVSLSDSNKSSQSERHGLLPNLLLDHGPELNISELLNNSQLSTPSNEDLFNYLVKLLAIVLAQADDKELNESNIVANSSKHDSNKILNLLLSSITSGPEGANENVSVALGTTPSSPGSMQSGLVSSYIRGKRSSDSETIRKLRLSEEHDKLAIDPYQSFTIINVNGSDPVVMKNGYGFFITDHYGVRYPYFNNTKLSQILLRMRRYQEANDFLLFGQPILMNMTQLTEKDFGTIKRRLNKIMETNRKRRDDIFLRMFEDFIWLRENKQVSRRSIPDSAKLGLPPGYTIAQFPDGQTRNITLGSREEYGGIPNPPLERSTEYEIVFAVMSTVADVTKHSWISVNATTKPEIPKAISPIFVILSGAFLAVCLFVLLLGCFVLWFSKRPRKSRYDDDQYDDYRLQLPPDFGSQPASPLVVGPKKLDPMLLSPYNQVYPPYPSPPPYPVFPPVSPGSLGFWPPPMPPPPPAPADTGESEAEKVPKNERVKKRKKRKKKVHTSDEGEESPEEEDALPNYIRKVHKPEAHWNRIYDPTSKRYIVDKRNLVRGGGEVGPDDHNNISDDDEGGIMKSLTFKDEFALLTDGQDMSGNALTDFSRFPHIPLCERTRVVLAPDTSSDNTYIHANHIEGCVSDGVSYIAAMSPFDDETVLDFWRMIYQYNIETIVMMTHTVEEGIVKCAEYWPPCSGTVRTLGHYLLQTVSQKRYADYTIREIVFKSRDSAKSHKVTQFQYTAWLPKCCPQCPVTLLDLRYWVRRHHESLSTPILVHCGTGVSRTAVFIAIDAMIDQYEVEGGVNVFNFVSKMRRDRPMMIRCLEHYVFIYTALQDEYEAGDTNIELEHGIQNAMIQLSQINPNSGQSYLEDQYELLNLFTLDFLSDDVNIARLLDNRYSQISPFTSNINSLNPIFIDGLRNQNQFVLMNSPTDKDITDFWHFVCQHNIVTIVQFGKDVSAVRQKKSGKRDGIGAPKMSKFVGKYVAESVSVNKQDVTLLRDILLDETTNSGKVNKRKIRHFSIPFRHVVCDHKNQSSLRKNDHKSKYRKISYSKRRSTIKATGVNHDLECAGEMCRLSPTKVRGKRVSYVDANSFCFPVKSSFQTEPPAPNCRYREMENEKNRANRIRDKRMIDRQCRDYKEPCCSRISKNDDSTFLVLRDGRLVKSCRNDNKSYYNGSSRLNAKEHQSKHTYHSEKPHTERRSLAHYRRPIPRIQLPKEAQNFSELGNKTSPPKQSKCNKVLLKSGEKSAKIHTSRKRRASRSLSFLSNERRHRHSRQKRSRYTKSAAHSRHSSPKQTKPADVLGKIQLLQKNRSNLRHFSPKQTKPTHFLGKIKLFQKNRSNSSSNSKRRYLQSLSKITNFVHLKESKQSKLKMFPSSVEQQLSAKWTESRDFHVLHPKTSNETNETNVTNSALINIGPTLEENNDACFENLEILSSSNLLKSLTKTKDSSNSALITVLHSPDIHGASSRTLTPLNNFNMDESLAQKASNKYLFQKQGESFSALATKSANHEFRNESKKKDLIQPTMSNRKKTALAASSSTFAEDDSIVRSMSPRSRVQINLLTNSSESQSSSSIRKDHNESARKMSSKLDRERKRRKKRKGEAFFESDGGCKDVLSPNQLLDLHELIWRWQNLPRGNIRQNPDAGPILIHGPGGSREASLLCACALVCEQVQEEQEVDVYHVIKYLRRKYPTALGSFEEYDFLHRVLFHYVTECMDEVSVSERWRYRKREEQVYSSVIENTLNPMWYNNTTYNKSHSQKSGCAHYVQDFLSMTDQLESSAEQTLKGERPPLAAPQSTHTIELSTQSSGHSVNQVKIASESRATEEADVNVTGSYKDPS
ncbi:receptor-type tyrosine-protein phosphatase F [Biomphalaria pfeifferi]|uniref:protein-tyrosine-phosphatase n=1 Tax=Biomphalaria pfeifferi TaxID=112525 RepID=A0AAD8B5F4_BIOPF|nr:receptor-type tyrosine-protein phosphatase F [Biomphalaria pfeifferi]